MGRTYYYMRISTAEERGKQKFTRQEKAIQDYCKNQNIDYDEHDVFKDDCSGKTFDRPSWKSLKSRLQAGDTVVFKDISRFTRVDTKEAYEAYMDLMKQGIRLVFIDNPIVSTDYIQELVGTAKKSNIITETAMESTVKLLLIVELNRVEEERKNISKRIKDGIAASEKKTGECRKGKVFKLDESLKEDIKNYLADRTIKKSDILKDHKMSPNTLDKYIKIVKKEMEEEAPGC